MDVGQVGRRVLHSLLTRKRGEGATLAYLKEFEATQYFSQEKVAELQLSRAKILIQHAYERCPFYRERFRAARLLPKDIRKLNDLALVPALEKGDIQESGRWMIAEGFSKRQLIANQTGGSTGSPLSFYLNRERKCSRAAATLRHNAWAGWKVGMPVAVLWGAPRDEPGGPLLGRMRRRLVEHELFLDAGDITEQRLEMFCGQLNRFRPEIILGYARVVSLLAQYVRGRGIELWRPRAIVTSAEVLEDGDRKIAEAALGAPIFNRYGCREVSVIASECAAHAGLHTMAEGLYIEILRGNEPAPPGEVGSIVITDLLNYAMPLIRYRIGDVAAWQEGKCSCGRGLPRLSRVGGRVTDFLLGDGGKLVSGAFLSLYLVGQRPSLGQVQIVQARNGTVRFRICRGSGFQGEADLNYLRAATRQHVGAKIGVEFEFVNEIRAEASGKFLFCRSEAAAEYLRGWTGARAA